MTPRRPSLSQHPDFGTAMWDSPDRNRPFTLRFSVAAIFDFGRFREIVGDLRFDDHPYAIRIRTPQSGGEIATMMKESSDQAGALWVLNGRAERVVQEQEGGGEYQPVTGWVTARKPASL